ncbi:paraquat-inducible protein A [Belnapia sp. T6]|uniref:Paraquat-inducible protein A n=1 Tax=Belnapia mucosa TaxID=2804532 RepID=A0ABS1VFG2_9PROT|nr:paraquat-inducible protein A [Belnapia mucosa]MBL6459143.1 paraquat-inducible protein A [Belnapia mucosa]
MAAAPADPAARNHPAARRGGSTPPRSRECPDCGRFQLVPSLGAGATARCLQCGAVLRRTHHDPLGRALALHFAALAMLGVAGLMSLMTVSTAGMNFSADLLSGPQGLHRHGLWELALVVLFTTAVAPFLRLASMAYVLVGLGLRRPPRHLQRLFAWIEHLRPWSMVEVYLLGVFVAYVKLVDIVHIEIGPALYALGALMLIMVVADAVLDRQAVWEEMERRGIPNAEIDHAAVPRDGPEIEAIGCETCGLVCLPAVTEAEPRCPRCGSRLHARKPDSVARTWALVIASLVLYVPANVYPVLTVVQLGAGAPSTILGGVEELLSSSMYPLAALVFLASVVVPMLKLIGLVTMLVATQAGWTGRLRDRTSLFRVVRAIGRWSMIDVFMISVLVALVQFGAVVTIAPGLGAVAFAAVVILTMFAAETFDPRLMWDAAARRERRVVA